MKKQRSNLLKRASALVLALMICVSMLQVSALAADPCPDCKWTNGHDTTCPYYTGSSDKKDEGKEEKPAEPVEKPTEPEEKPEEKPVEPPKEEEACTHSNVSYQSTYDGAHAVVCTSCSAFSIESCDTSLTGQTGPNMGKCSKCGYEQPLNNTCTAEPIYQYLGNNTHSATWPCTCTNPDHKQPIVEGCTMEKAIVDNATGAVYYQCPKCKNGYWVGQPRECEHSADGKHHFAPKTGEPGESWEECADCHAVRNYKNEKLPQPEPDCTHPTTHEVEIEATHKKAGKVYVYCDECKGIITIKNCPPLSGECDGQEIDRQDPTCDEDGFGWVLYECKDPKCGEKWEVKLDPIDHDYTNQKWQDRDDDDVHFKVCKRNPEHTLLKEEHHYEEASWTATKDDAGVEENFCTDCHHRITRDVFRTLTIHYHYANKDGEVAEDYVHEYQVGRPYSVTSPEAPEGYEIEAGREVIAGNMLENDVVETVKYSPIPYTQTIIYRYADGTVINRVEREFNVENRAELGSVPTPVIEGYTFDRGEVGAPAGLEDETVYVTYTAVEPEESTPPAPPTPVEPDEPTPPTPEEPDEPVDEPDVPLEPTPDIPDEPDEPIDEPDVPLDPTPDIPDEPDEPDEPIDEPDTPLAPEPELPEEPGDNGNGEEEIDDTDVPLSDVPKTGDVPADFFALLAAGCGLALIRTRKNAVK